jgi:hypothetical protein
MIAAQNLIKDSIINFTVNSSLCGVHNFQLFRIFELVLLVSFFFENYSRWVS